MPNIYGKYSLTELANLIGVTSAFINRIQRETGIGGQTGIKGQPVSFNEIDIAIFRRIKVLRKFDCSFHDIKEIWDLENNIIDLFKQYSRQKNEVDNKSIPLIIHSAELYVPKSHSDIKDSKKARVYFEEVKKLGLVARRIKELHETFLKEAKEVESIVNELRPLDWDEIVQRAVFTLTEISKISKDKQ